MIKVLPGVEISVEYFFHDLGFFGKVTHAKNQTFV